MTLSDPLQSGQTSTSLQAVAALSPHQELCQKKHEKIREIFNYSNRKYVFLREEKLKTLQKVTKSNSFPYNIPSPDNNSPDSVHCAVLVII